MAPLDGILTLDGILLVDKPQGATSFAVVHHVRRALQRAFPQVKDGHAARPPDVHGQRPARFRCGHAGTLDPMATGLLVVLVGKATRLAPFLTGLDKTYLATVSFGVETDTLDAEGQAVLTAPPPPDPEAVFAILPAFVGSIMQIPPVYSALKREGRSLHRLARAGMAVAPPPARPVTIHSLRAVGSRWGEPAAAGDRLHAAGMTYAIDLEVHCGSGTYVRSLVCDLARAAGSAGHLSRLRRTRVGPFLLEDAAAGIMDLEGGLIAGLIRPLESAVAHLPRLRLTKEQAAAVRGGGQPQPGWLEHLAGKADAGPASFFAMVAPDGRLVAVGQLAASGGPPVLRAVIAREEPACA